MKHILELNARYKMGHQQLTTPFSIIGRNIVRVERIPEELPDHQDGVLCRVQTSTGEFIGVTESYEEATRRWHEALEHASF